MYLGRARGFYVVGTPTSRHTVRDFAERGRAVSIDGGDVDGRKGREMGNGVNRRGPAVVLAAVAIAVAACSKEPSSAPSDEADLVVVRSRVTVNGDEVPKGESRAIAPDEQISLLDPTARGRLQVGELEFVLFKMAEMRLVKWEGDDIGTWLEHGHLRVTLAEDATSRLRLETSTNVVLTPLTADTEFTVCQTPPDFKPEPVTCLRVIKGEVEWVSGGAAKTYHAGESTFALGGEPPQGVRCLSAAAYEQWFQDALSEEPPADLPDLGGLVNDAPDCPAVGADESTSSTAATSSTTATTTTTSAPAGTAATTGQRPPATGHAAAGHPAAGHPGAATADGASHRGTDATDRTNDDAH